MCEFVGMRRGLSSKGWHCDIIFAEHWKSRAPSQLALLSILLRDKCIAAEPMYEDGRGSPEARTPFGDDGELLFEALHFSGLIR